MVQNHIEIIAENCVFLRVEGNVSEAEIKSISKHPKLTKRIITNPSKSVFNAITIQDILKENGSFSRIAG